MITITRGNLVEADAEALVNTVNCVGYMGRGIALQFKKAFPANFEAYRRACRAKEVQPGRVFVHQTGSMVNPKYIINFPTKRHWRGKSRLSDIEAGLQSLIKEICERGIESVAVPPLGCGLGGLDWDMVRPMIERAMADLPDVQVMLFEPAGTPDARAMPVRTTRPKMTTSRALLVMLIDQYRGLAYRLTLLEIHKLAYFLQEAGERLKLKYEPGPYGPYAHNLNKVLELMEGHFTRGYGDTQRPDVEIDLLPDAAEEAMGFLSNHQDSQHRLAEVAKTIEGFETPYGMELLASVHWVVRHGNPPAESIHDAIIGVHNWSDRKRQMFNPDHIRIAWKRLNEDGSLLAREGA